MNEDFRNDVLAMREYLLNAVKAADQLKALSEGAPMSSASMQQTLEKVSSQFEYAVLGLRRICERYCAGVGGYPKLSLTETEHPTGKVEIVNGRWVRVTLNTLLPHCRFYSPAWLSDTIRRMLDEYEHDHDRLPFFPKAVLVIEEACSIGGRRIFDQDNKGWKAVANAVKGWLIPDDDQFSLSIALRSVFSDENCCRILIGPEDETPEIIKNCQRRQQI